jgi:ribonuclease P protein component
VSCEASNADQGFPRTARLLTAADFRRVFNDPKRSSDRFFTVLAAPRQETVSSRLGLAIAKKHIKLASGRNRVKRLVRETFRSMRQSMVSTDFVVLAKPATGDASNAELVASLNRHFERLTRN